MQKNQCRHSSHRCGTYSYSSRAKATVQAARAVAYRCGAISGAGISRAPLQLPYLYCSGPWHPIRQALRCGAGDVAHIHWGSRTTIRAQTTSSPKEPAMRQKTKCGAYARTTGNPCKAKAMPNGRCKNHGGMSTGPKTLAGRSRIAEATRQRMASGQRKRVLEGFYRWLEGGGREMLSRFAKARERRRRWRRLMLE